MFPRFFMTTEECSYHGVTLDQVPVFYSEEGVMSVFTDYMIHLRWKRRGRQSSTETYAFHLQGYLKFLKSKGWKWEEPSDETLCVWRDSLLNGLGHKALSPSTVSGYIQTVFSFYLWAELEGHLEGVLKTSDDDNRKSLRVSVKRTNGRHGASLTWPYLPKSHGKPLRHVPTTEELNKVHEKAFDSTTGRRDTLLMSFYEEGALRRGDALSLKVSDIPSWDEIADKEDANETFSLHFVGKGRRERYVPFTPGLLQLAREYLEGDRAEVIKAAKARNPMYRPPVEFFIDHIKGTALSPAYISRRISELMKSVGVKRASGHRIRARGLVNIVEAYDGFDEHGRAYTAEMVLIKAAERAGHGSIDSLKPYLNFARAPLPDSPGGVTEASRLKLRELDRTLRDRGATVKRFEMLRPLVESLEANDMKTFKAKLEEILKSI